MTPRPTNRDSLFTSARERRLWLLTLVVVVAIYLTLGLTPVLTDALRDRELIDATFGLGMLLVGAAIVTVAWRTQLSGIEIGVVLGVVAAYLLVVARLALPAEERTHLIEYGIVAVFILAALTERAHGGRQVPVPALLAIVTAVVIGTLDESIQAFMPTRVFDVRDLAFNSLAAVMAVIASVALGWARRRRQSMAAPR